MKIAVITMQCPINYGAVLQSFALQSFLENIGAEVEIIDYRPKYLTYTHNLTYIGNERAKNNPLFGIAYLLLKFKQRYTIRCRFADFLKRFLHLTSKSYYSLDELVKEDFGADVFICGSDQIWNTSLPNGNDDAYFLSFVNKEKKISYAASMAVNTELSIDNKARFKKLLSDFSAISVREDNAVSLLSFLGRSVTQVLDPVFLLSKKDWIEKFRLTDGFDQKPYILIYPMGDGKSVFQHANRLSNETGLPVYSISQSSIKEKFISRVFKDIGPVDFLRLILNAEYVVTNSFHGTAFSIIFRKNFWSCSIINTSSRIESLLRCVGLNERLLKDTENDRNLLSEIDYSEIENGLNNSIALSKQFLINNTSIN